MEVVGGEWGALSPSRPRKQYTLIRTHPQVCDLALINGVGGRVIPDISPE